MSWYRLAAAQKNAAAQNSIGLLYNNGRVVSEDSAEAFCFFSSRRRHTTSLCDWSSDVCSSDLTPPAPGQDEKTWHHGLSLFGDLKYPDGFKQFDYVNAQAPKAGVARQVAFGTFDNFNTVVAGVKGSIAGGVDFIYD